MRSPRSRDPFRRHILGTYRPPPAQGPARDRVFLDEIALLGLDEQAELESKEETDESDGS